MRLADGRKLSVIDLPATYSLQPATPEDQVTLDVILGHRRLYRRLGCNPP